MNDNDDESDTGGLDLFSATFEYLELDFELQYLTTIKSSEDVPKATLERLGYAVAMCLERHLNHGFYDWLVENQIIHEDYILRELLKGGFGVDHMTPDGGDI